MPRKTGNGLLAALCEGALRRYSRYAPSERGSYRLARMVRQLRRRERWRDWFITPDNLELELDLGTYPDCCMAFGLYELTTARLIRRLLRGGDHFVDCGANIGYFTMIAAQRVGPSGRVDAFEPHPENLARLKAHLQANALDDRVNVHEIALSDRAGRSTMYMPRGGTANHGMATLFEPTGRTCDVVEVEMERLDEMLAGTSPTLVKLDVEGAELYVIEGMTALLTARHPPAILAEYNAPASRLAGTEPHAFIERALAVQPAYRAYLVDRRLRRIASIQRELARHEVVNVFLWAHDSEP